MLQHSFISLSPSPEERESYHQYWVVPLVFLITFVVYYLKAMPLLNDSDVPWHLATGRWLLENHRVPAVDPWSFASHDQPWYLLSWIWDLLLGITERISGVFGVYVLAMSISAAIPALLAAHLLQRRVALPAIFFTIMVASLALLDFITARPHLSGYMMALIFYLILYHSRSDNHYRRLWLLPLLMLIWANMHGSFISGFSVLGAYVIEAYFTKNHAWLKRLLVVSVLCAICAAINPYGMEVIIGALRTLNGSTRQGNMEWLPFTFSTCTGISTWLILFALANNLRASHAFIADKLLAVGWMVGALFITRNGPIFVILSAPYLAICLDEITQGLRQARPPSLFMHFMQRQKLSHLWLSVLVIYGLLVAAASMLPHQGRIISDDMSVKDAVDYAQAHYPDQRYMTDFNFGGQVIYYTYGKLHFFMDSRAGTVYSEDALKAYIAFLNQQSGWEELIKPYDINGIMISNSTPFAKAYANGQYHDQWQLMFAGARANVYIARF